jgi:transcriptional regulator with XRE-family HTH domain/Zn-dependent peptidase ImmA (M78 family)
MEIGSRLRLARKQRGLSVRKLGEIVGVSGVAVSKYERDLDMPSSRILLQLCQALDLDLERLFRSTAVVLSEPAYRKRSDLSVRQCKTLMTAIQNKAERYGEVEELAQRHRRPRLPTLVVSDVKDVEDAAVRLRFQWRLGTGAIPSMVALLEDHDIQVVDLAVSNHFDACALESDGQPFIVTREDAPADQVRSALAHILAHLVLVPSSGKLPERLANRFAAAFLVPAQTALRELGERRSHLSKVELELLKAKYGLSIAGWIHRAADLKIISATENLRWQKLRNLEGWRTKEPSCGLSPEEPHRMERMIMRAYAEGEVTGTRAAELLDWSLEKVLGNGEEHADSFVAEVTSTAGM